MFIRQTQTGNSQTGERYITYRLVNSERIGGKVRQNILLNLGRHFPIKPEEWTVLCARIEQLLRPGGHLFDLECSLPIERAAQRYTGLLITRAPAVSDAPAPAETDDQALAQSPTTPAPTTPSPSLSPASPHSSCAVPGAPLASQPSATRPPPETPAPDFHEVDVDSLRQSQPRTVGVEQVALNAMKETGLIDILNEVGFNGVMRAAALGNIIGRMAQPASELATWKWLQTQSGLGDLTDFDYGGMSHTSLYRASDMLMRHRDKIESTLFDTIKNLFSLEETVTLYDLTNTYFEGDAEANPKAKHGRSKEKRSDCPLVTLGMVLDGSGFVRRSKTFEGNVAEGTTLETMLTGLNAPPGALVIMDAGIATTTNLAWLVERNYRYLVVRRGGVRQFDASHAVSFETAGDKTIQVQKVLSEDGKEVQLFCYSEERKAKETAMTTRFCERFEAGLQKLADGLSKPRCAKHPDRLHERIGRLKEANRGVGQHYQITLVADDAGKVATALTWERLPVTGTMATHPGVYCLRSNETSWDEERLWRTYTMLTDLESVFRSLKHELGLRPVFHQKEDRSDGHLFITVLAYQCVQFLRTKLKAAGIHDSWSSLRQTLSVQQRVTATFTRKDGRTVHVRKSTVAEPDMMKIYRALGVNPVPGRTCKRIF